MNTKSGWIRVLQPDKIQTSLSASRAHRVTSPYDVPEAFRITSLDGDKFLFEFRYIDSGEQTSNVNLDGQARARLGKSTHRILAIELSRPELEAGALVKRFHKVIQELSEKDSYKGQAAWNYRAAREAVDLTMSDIQEQLAHAR